ncbi:hypothetical protein [Rhodococcus wratislaviensis]|uniref:hypothetical protein n=1 Tax=Rhodococcus wratislaviensis TaxID=44752 RepID=UPI00366047E2
MSYRELAPAQINYDEQLTEDERLCIEKSVAALVDRAARNTARRRTMHDLQAEARAAMNKSLLEVIKSGPEVPHFDASEIQPKVTDRKIDRSGPLFDDKDLNVEQILKIGGVASKIFAKPFHYDWKWSNTGGTHQLNYAADKGGFAGIDALVDTGVAHIKAHAGVGVALNTQTLNSTMAVTVTGRALRWTTHKWTALGSIWNGHAVTEGGVELTAFVDGIPLVNTDLNAGKLWRRRCSDGEIDGYEEDPGWAVGEPIELTWTMVPGRTYTFNIGAWVYVECDDGAWGSDSWAWAHLLMDVGALTLFK